MRRHRNKIKSIKNNLGEWITEDEEVKNFILAGYREIYDTSHSFSVRDSDIINFSCSFLSDEEKELLEKPATEEEIKRGLWALKPFKVPGAEGLHARFFQFFWADVKNLVCKEIMDIFQTRAIPEYLNETLIWLIPKCQSPESLCNYHPISLCNSIYKVVSKIIVARLRPFLDKIISPVQAAFVPGRKGLDNIIIAQELIHSIDKKKGRFWFMAVKIDLAKAYDRLEWSFILKVLLAFRFPQSLIVLIMSCISSTSMSILFNGGKLDTFKPSRGIRQGDPLSPYLFIICIEYLGQLIEKECLKKRWIPMKASRENIGVSHLFFADDLMFFAKVGEKGNEAIKEVLDKFCEDSGQVVRFEKSKIYFSPNVPSRLKEKICNNLDIQATSSICKYLGFPLRHRGASRGQFNFVVEKVLTKLAGWKTKFLSFAGRTVLVKSLLNTVPNYVMQGAALLAHLCDKLDKINRDFLWGSTTEKRRMHLVGWNKVIRPIEEGGLGIQAARAKNIALLAKLNWRLYQEKDALWAKVILRKYCSISRQTARDPDKLPCSPCWTAVKTGFPTFVDGICWSVGRRSKLKFWEDKWVKGKSVVELDAKVVIELVCATNTPNRYYTPLLNDCSTLLSRFQGMRIKHVYREGNKCADMLARESCWLMDDFVVLDSPLSNDLCILLDADTTGMYFVRLVANYQPTVAS